MRTKISAVLKKQVVSRAHGRCEYCLLPESVSFYSFHIDHIKSIKHGGASEPENLAYCCPDCNFSKGSDIGTFSADDEYIVRFYNPRKDNWNDHFELQNSAIIAKTEIGKSTVRILQFNESERLLFRLQIAALGFYPPNQQG